MWPQAEGSHPCRLSRFGPAGTGSVSDGGGSQEASAEEAEEEVVRLSPELATHDAIDPVTLPSSTSKRRLSISVSKKLSMNIPDKLRLSRRKHKDHHHKATAAARRPGRLAHLGFLTDPQRPEYNNTVTYVCRRRRGEGCYYACGV
ncbi:Putative disease resistance RPP13-like protein 1 [Zea mays]|uniref:Putative disease resistance RPP13-like protein 1 n=1 Tax=Zea mays TaxID=4577 RepID=A0A1D6NVC3_MAIZE|nr:Putative disease resistance RPP13-like protein 1 [Zea mays]